MKKRDEWIGLILGFIGSMVGLVMLVLFNQYVLGMLPQPFKALSTFPTYWFIAVAIIVLMIVFKDKLSSIGFCKEKIGLQILIGIGLGVAMSAVLTLLPHLVGLGEYFCSPSGYTKWWQYCYEFTYCILAVGAAEEFVFRGYLFTKLKNISGKNWVAVLVSSIMFGFFHIFAGGLGQMFMTALIGLLLCFFKLKIKNCTLLSLIIAHGVYDALIVVITAVMMGV